VYVRVCMCECVCLCVCWVGVTGVLGILLCCLYRQQRTKRSLAPTHSLLFPSSFLTACPKPQILVFYSPCVPAQRDEKKVKIEGLVCRFFCSFEDLTLKRWDYAIRDACICWINCPCCYHFCKHSTSTLYTSMSKPPTQQPYSLCVAEHDKPAR